MSTAGCVLFLIDESAAMASDFPDDAPTGPSSAPPGPPPVPGTSAAPVTASSKATRLATAVNAWIKRSAAHSAADIALVGYATDAEGAAAVSCRWGAGLSGRTWVPLPAAVAEPLRVEQRKRRLPPSGVGAAAEQTVEFPVWLEPRTAGRAAQLAGWSRCVELLNEWLAYGVVSRQPVIVHVFGSTSADGNPQRVIEQVRQHPAKPIILQIHLRTSRSVTPTLYPSNIFFLPAGGQKDLFKRCSPLPEEWKSALQSRKQAVQSQAVAMVYNARLADVALALNLVEAHVDGAGSALEPTNSLVMPSPAPAAAVAPLAPATPAGAVMSDADSAPPESSLPLQDSFLPEPMTESADHPVEIETGSLFADPVPVERTGPRAAVFLFDRSTADPYGSALNSPFSKLQERLNRSLGVLSKKPTGQLYAAVVTYAGDDGGNTDVRTEQWNGDQAGREWVSDSELATAAIRIEETTEERPNGIGGLMSIPIKKPIYLEVENSGQGSLAVAVAHVGQCIEAWSQLHGGQVRDVVVVHFSRAGWTPEEILSASSELAAAAIPVVMYHVLIPDTPHPAASYPTSSDGLALPELRAAFEATGALRGAAGGEVSRPGIVSPESRGITINADFDVLAESLRVGLTP